MLLSRIAVGIVTYNSAKHIGACLNSIAVHLSSALPFVVIFDNASNDDTVEQIESSSKKYSFPIELIRSSENLGYAFGVNRIMEVVKADWVCLINPDARLQSDPLEPAIEFVKRVPTSGIVGGIQFDENNSPQEAGGVFPSPLMAVWDWCGLRHIIPRKNWSTTLSLDLPADAPPRRIDYPTGAFWIFRREVFRRVGAFDERFFLYFEETDFCRRAKEIGWTSHILPSIRILHERGGSFEFDKETRVRDPLSIYFESMFIYLYKHFPKRNVDLSIWFISIAMKIRKLVIKGEKSERIINAFEIGLGTARNKIQVSD
ncbi:MAG: glycosyltransferase family 2 protein [bacterium]